MLEVRRGRDRVTYRDSAGVCRHVPLRAFVCLHVPGRRGLTQLMRSLAGVLVALDLRRPVDLRQRGNGRCARGPRRGAPGGDCSRLPVARPLRVSDLEISKSLHHPAVRFADFLDFLACVRAR